MLFNFHGVVNFGIIAFNRTSVRAHPCRKGHLKMATEYKPKGHFQKLTPPHPLTKVTPPYTSRCKKNHTLQIYNDYLFVRYFIFINIPEGATKPFKRPMLEGVMYASSLTDIWQIKELIFEKVWAC